MPRLSSSATFTVAFALFAVSCSDTSPSATPDAAAPSEAAVIDAPAGDGFTFVSEAAADCPLSPSQCESTWPTTGTITRWTSAERFGDRVHERSAWLYRPPGTEGQPLPLLVVLHGGNGNGAAMFARRFDELARGERVGWRRATATCTFTYPDGFADANGNPCTGELVSYTGAAPFALLFPDGIESASTGIPGARHWEDGRTPSPGQLTDEAVRDDVGFLAHLVGQALARPDSIDAERIYFDGWSNGGMMTARVLCEREQPGREPLLAIAGAVLGIAALPANLYDGTAGRLACPRASTSPPAIFVQVGRGIATPDCAPYPCTTPTVDGDGIMPFGAAGEQHRVASPDGGFVQSVADTVALLRGSLAAAYGADAPAVQTMIGTHTVQRTTTFGGDTVELRVLATEGGAHQTAGTRGEFASEARQWQFLAGFRRSATGIVRRVGAAVTGTY
jgi:poly(3-hydroxybutyrate) depolymerase